MVIGRNSHFRSEDLDKPVLQLFDWNPHRSTSVVRDDKPITVNAGADFWGFEYVHAAIVSGLTDLVQLVLSIG